MSDNKYCILRIEKLKNSFAQANARLNHNTRTKPLSTEDAVDIQSLYIPDSPSEEALKNGWNFEDFFKHYANPEQKIRKNALLGFEIVLTFSKNGIPPKRFKEWCEENIKFVSKVFGKHNIAFINAHLSEETPHLHILTTAFIEDSKTNQLKLSGNQIIKGPNHIRQLQTDYAEIMAKFSLCRGIDKRITKSQYQNAKRFWGDLNNKQTLLQTYQDCFGEENDKNWDLDTVKKFKECKNKNTIKKDSKPINIEKDEQDR